MFGFFRRQPPPSTESQLSSTVAYLVAKVDGLAREVTELREHMGLQEKGLKALELDWQEWFDKFRLMYARLSKRIKDAAEATGDAPESPQDAPGPTNAPSARVQDRARRNY